MLYILEKRKRASLILQNLIISNNAPTSLMVSSTVTVPSLPECYKTSTLSHINFRYNFCVISSVSAK